MKQIVTVVALATIAVASACGPDIQKDPGVVYVNNQQNNASNSATNSQTNSTSTNNVSTNNVSMNSVSTNNVSMNNVSMNNVSMNNVSMNNGSTNNVSMNNASTNNASTNNAGSEACLNTGDLALLSDVANREPIEECGLSCVTATDLSVCSADCIQTEVGLTAGCSVCFGDLTECSTTNCFAECVESSASMECEACQAMYCQDNFEACSGVDADAF